MRGRLRRNPHHLHESLFKRPDGISVLVATSTLAQGMNLPSEVVIIGGDSRFDPDADKMQKLEAHELLNAAGRAGRAGDGSHGFVLVVPSKVVHFNNDTSTIHSHWSDLRAIFAQSDQCLVIDDPMTSLLDQIHTAAASASAMAKYLVRRLPVGELSGEDGGDVAARTLLSRSFAAFRARARGDQAWIDARIESAITARHADPEAPEILTWADRLAAAAGVPVAIIRDLGEPLAGPIRQDAPMSDWYNWVVKWLTDQPARIPQLIRRESLEDLFGATYKNLGDDDQRGQHAAPRIFLLLSRWMAGGTFADLERAFGTPEHRIGKCETAREFALRIVPELAYIFGLPGQIFRALMADRGTPVEPPLGLDSLGPCVRNGLDKIEKLAVRRYRKGLVSRRAVHKEFAAIERGCPAVC